MYTNLNIIKMYIQIVFALAKIQNIHPHDIVDALKHKMCLQVITFGEIIEKFTSTTNSSWTSFRKTATEALGVISEYQTLPPFCKTLAKKNQQPQP